VTTENQQEAAQDLPAAAALFPVDWKFERTATWLASAGREVGNRQHLSVQVGCHIEEFVEFIRELSITSTSGITITALQEVSFHLEACAEVLKRGLAAVEIHDREAALDALCDMDVTGNGVACMAGFKKTEGDWRTIKSNESKFVDGKAVFSDAGKIAKGPDFVPADYSDLV
jgi:hypothetical protein